MVLSSAAFVCRLYWTLLNALLVMGNLLRVLYNREPADSPNIFVDFESEIFDLLCLA